MVAARVAGRAISAMFRSHSEAEAFIAAPVSDVFAYLDDFRRLSAHMASPSAMMLGSSMKNELDAGNGRSVGSRIAMTGKVLGIPLGLEEVVSERVPPLRKSWHTVAAHLLVIGQYRLGFELAEAPAGSRLRVRIDYDLPRGPARLLGWLLAGTYARWCVRSMVADAKRYFERPVFSGA